MTILPVNRRPLKYFSHCINKCDDLHYSNVLVYCTLNISHFTMHYLQYRLQTAHCLLYNVTAHSILYTTSAHCTLNPVHWTLLSVHWTQYPTHFTIQTIHWTLHTTHWTWHHAHCTLYTVHCKTSHCTLKHTHYTLHTANCTMLPGSIKIPVRLVFTGLNILCTVILTEPPTFSGCLIWPVLSAHFTFNVPASTLYSLET